MHNVMPFALRASCVCLMHEIVPVDFLAKDNHGDLFIVPFGFDNVEAVVHRHGHRRRFLLQFHALLGHALCSGALAVHIDVRHGDVVLSRRAQVRPGAHPALLIRERALDRIEVPPGDHDIRCALHGHHAALQADVGSAHRHCSYGQEPCRQSSGRCVLLFGRRLRRHFRGLEQERIHGRCHELQAFLRGNRHHAGGLRGGRRGAPAEWRDVDIPDRGPGRHQHVEFHADAGDRRTRFLGRLLFQPRRGRLRGHALRVGPHWWVSRLIRCVPFHDALRCRCRCGVVLLHRRGLANRRGAGGGRDRLGGGHAQLHRGARFLLVQHPPEEERAP
mmetsp:Transcript_80125/g.244966  ORF Transcript_80125/g.244966 Transcript_80125/m.244966 type:complete len:332 (+) Transcript_80125:970-1965(+)